MNEARKQERREKLWEDFRDNIGCAFQNWIEYRYSSGPKDQSGDKFDKCVKSKIPEFFEDAKKELMNETY